MSCNQHLLYNIEMDCYAITTHLKEFKLLSIPSFHMEISQFHHFIWRYLNSIISYGDILLHLKILLCTSAKFIGMLSYLQRGRIETRHGYSQKCERGVAKLCLPPRFWPLLRKTELLPWKQKLFRENRYKSMLRRQEWLFSCLLVLKRTWIYNAINKCKFLSSNMILWSKTNFIAMQINI